MLCASLCLFFLLLVSIYASSEAMIINGASRMARHTVTSNSATMRSQVVLKMGLFDFFGPKKSAEASHILVKGSNSADFLTKLKAELDKSKNKQVAFADAAAKYSACPSSKKGGSLGKFNQGQMVPAFDKVVFNDAIGEIHGPISTQFGNHLILISERSE